MTSSRTPTESLGEMRQLPRVGVPWRTTQEERDNTREKLNYYFEAIRKAGAEPVEVSLQQSPEQLEQTIEAVDAFVLPGSPADVDPLRYHAAKHPKTQELDANRDTTDIAILDHALKNSKPVLAICYGCQLLNVYLGGTLLQDIRAQKPDAIAHGNTDLPPGAVKGDVQHGASLAPDSRLSRIRQGHGLDAHALDAKINSSHHQAVDAPGRDLRVTARASDGIVEAIEWTGDANWVVGVQWHPERMAGDAFSERLFRDFVQAARHVRRPVLDKA